MSAAGPVTAGVDEDGVGPETATAGGVDAVVLGPAAAVVAAVATRSGCCGGSGVGVGDVLPLSATEAGKLDADGWRMWWLSKKPAWLWWWNGGSPSLLLAATGAALAAMSLTYCVVPTRRGTLYCSSTRGRMTSK